MSKQLYQKECIICGKTFTASRFDAKYCSPRCGQLAYKQLNGGTIPTPAEMQQHRALGAAPIAAPTAAPTTEKKEAAPQKDAEKQPTSTPLPQNFDWSAALNGIKQDQQRRNEVKDVIKDAFRELVREELAKQPQREITVQHKDTPLSALNLLLTGTDIALGKADNNALKAKLDQVLANQVNIANNQQQIYKVIQSVQMDVKAIKRALNIFPITAEYSPKFKQYLFVYKQGNTIVKEDVNGKILDTIAL